ncbi:hypothetical protein [Rhodococcus spongiicola]|uniref:Uncharacterized protein n=1 Tax=Rhodococcus spongiicola TaxID=2487352 RepID=A0A3S3AB13_9NOCA|nr:hypothetical protein [Rhodococcus spongiicola]RVW06051.1 hypothetical protein EF834_00860 [Rhodococcus spongiicola]
MAVDFHVALTSRHLAKLGKRREFVNVEPDVPTLLAHGDEHIDAVAAAASAIENGLVELSMHLPARKVGTPLGRNGTRLPYGDDSGSNEP